MQRLLDIYVTLFEYGLDPNFTTILASKTIWQLWLWQICEEQTCHGKYEEDCTKAMKLFLSSGADPFVTIFFRSDRVSKSHLSVAYIVENLFGEDNRRDLRAALDAAKRRWKTKDPKDHQHHHGLKRKLEAQTVPLLSRSQAHAPNTGKKRRKCFQTQELSSI